MSVAQNTSTQQFNVNGAADPFAEVDDNLVEPEEIHGEDLPSPLDVTPGAFRSLGWLDDYAAFASGRTASPVEFHILGGLALGALALGRRAYLPMAFGDIYSNIYGAIIAKSSVYHKTSALNMGYELLYRAEMTNLQLSNLMTPEGLLAEMENTSTGLVMRDEIATLFDSHNTKYLRELKPLLTDIYDGRTIKRRLSNKEFTVRDPHLNIMGATTPDAFFDAVAARDWRDGFLARWLFVMPEGEPDFDADVSMRTDEHDAMALQLAKPLKDIRQQPVKPFVFDEGALKLWDRWRKDSIRAAYHYGDDTISQIVTRNATYALKFAMILSALNGPYGRITLVTMQTAMDLADTFKRNIHRVLQGRQNHGISGAKLQKVFQAIKQMDTNPTGRDIMRKAHMRADEVNLVLDKLCEIGAVIYTDEGRTRRYANTADALPIKAWK